MEKTHSDYQPFDSIDSYVDLVIRCLEIIPPDVTIHRLTADAPRSILINPPWSFNKRTILNRVQINSSILETHGKVKNTGIWDQIKSDPIYPVHSISADFFDIMYR